MGPGRLVLKPARGRSTKRKIEGERLELEMRLVCVRELDVERLLHERPA